MLLRGLMKIYQFILFFYRRNVANVVVGYDKFSHSNIISVFNPEGVLKHQQEGLGVNNKETVESILGQF